MPSPPGHQSWRHFRGIAVVIIFSCAESVPVADAHAIHWRNYLSRLLTLLDEEPPKHDTRYEIWKNLVAGRVRSFLVEDPTYKAVPRAAREYKYNWATEGGVLVEADDSLWNSDRLSSDWRMHLGQALMQRPGVSRRQYHRIATPQVANTADVPMQWRHPNPLPTNKVQLQGRTTTTLYPRPLIELISTQRVLPVRDPPVLHCRCRAEGNESATNSSNAFDIVVPQRTTTQAPLLLVVPGLMVAPHDTPLAIIHGSPSEKRLTTQVAQRLLSPAAAANASAGYAPKWALRMRRFRFVILLVLVALLISSLLAVYMRSYLAKYRREYEIIKAAQFT
ncbi:uncharacterized protein LOC144141462 [Haemaphysalis longicornis]